MIITTEKTYKYITTVDDVNQMIKELHEYSDNTERPIFALDLETYRTDGLDEVGRPIKRTSHQYEGMVRTIQIGYSPLEFKDKQYVVDVLALSSKLSMKDIGLWLKPILETATIIGQNLKYEYQFMYVLFGIELKKMRDCMLVSQVLLAGDKLKHRLSSLYKEFLHYGWFSDFTGMDFAQYEVFKDELQKSNWLGELSDDQIRYAADDVRIVFYLYQAQMDRLNEFVDKYEVSNNKSQTITNVILLECDLIPVYAMMELRGIQFDTNHHKQVVNFLEENRDIAEKQVGKFFSRKVKKTNGLKGKDKEIFIVDEPINIGSWQQKKEALKPFMPAQWYESRGGTDEATLELYKNNHPSIPYILDYGKANSKLNKYGNNMFQYCDHKGRMHPNWFQIGSDEGSIDTGRSSCTKPPMQTIPNNEANLFGKTDSELFRAGFIAKPGYKLIDADYSQEEPRLTAEIFDEESMIKEFQCNEDVDVHSMTAKIMFNLDYLPDQKSHERKVGKQLNLGLGYGMGAKKLASKLEISVDEAKAAIDAYYENLPNIKAAKIAIERQVRRKADLSGTLESFKGRKPIAVVSNPFGRVRRWCLHKRHETWAEEDPRVLHRSFKGSDIHGKPFKDRLSECSREAFNFMVQGLAADILKIALLRLHNKFIELGFDLFEEGIVAVVHDEILVEVREDHVELAKQVMREIMLDVEKIFLKRVPPAVEVKVGNNWAQAH